MRGSLGEKIGEGLTADIHAWAPGQVLKLFRPAATRFGKHEARTTRAARAAGAPAPEVLDETMIEGRFGIVLPRYDGPTLTDLLLRGEVAPAQLGAILASLYFSIHKTAAPTGVVALRDWIDGASRQPGSAVPRDIAAGVLGLIDRLPPGDGLCHADLHPGNVIMTKDGPRIIDWACALRAHTIVDIGRAHVTLTELVAEDVDPEIPRAIDEAVQSEYARLAGISREDLTATLEPYLPILRALVVLQGRPATTAQRERLIQRIAAALLSE